MIHTYTVVKKPGFKCTLNNNIISDRFPTQDFTFHVFFLGEDVASCGLGFDPLCFPKRQAQEVSTRFIHWN
jgi:hypothetical protein